jgi:hypothetical protein
MPNFIYGIFIIAGVSLDFWIGLLELWMFALFLLLVLLVIIVRFKDTIESFLPMEGGFRKEMFTPWAKSAKGVAGITARAGSKIKKDIGVKKENIRKTIKDVPRRIYLPSWKPNYEIKSGYYIRKHKNGRNPS